MTLYCSREQVDHSRMSRKMSDGVSTRTLSLAELPAKSAFDQVRFRPSGGPGEVGENPVLRQVRPRAGFQPRNMTRQIIAVLAAQLPPGSRANAFRTL